MSYSGTLLFFLFSFLFPPPYSLSLSLSFIEYFYLLPISYPDSFLFSLYFSFYISLPLLFLTISLSLWLLTSSLSLSTFYFSLLLISYSDTLRFSLSLYRFISLSYASLSLLFPLTRTLSLSLINNFLSFFSFFLLSPFHLLPRYPSTSFLYLLICLLPASIFFSFSFTLTPNLLSL